MPTKARRHCVLCAKYATRGNYCDDHAPKRAEASGWWKVWYKREPWPTLRAQQLAREPLCAECLKENRYVKASEVDHIIPHKGDWQLFIDPSNHQSLCKKHHSAKTMRELNTIRRGG